VLFVANFTLSGYQRRLEEMATTDPLTGAANRQVFDLMFDQVQKSVKRREGTVSVMMCDLDRFKQVNDDYGHQAGDLVLQAVAETARECIRETDIVCRWGGEEFLFLLPDCSAEKAFELAEKIRLAVENRPVIYGRDEIRISVSMGVAELRPGERQADLVKRSDIALYAAKAAGRNRVERAA
jgi:diguanylate cyclase (GGDEF)-like protein